MMNEETTERETDGGSAGLEEGAEEGGDVVGGDNATHVERVDGPVATSGGEAVDARDSQALVYKPSGPVHITIGDRITQAQEELEPAEAPELPDVPCPYRGLEPFEAEHAALYFGREAMVERLVGKVRQSDFVAVVGPSGCGKSSLVKAGLVTALQEGALPGSEHWEIRIFRPGADPLRSLAMPLVTLLEPEMTEVDRIAEARKLTAHLRNQTVTLADVSARLREQHPALPCLVLVADQFEELYTECQDVGLRQAFIDALLVAAAEENISIILTLRADFYGHVLANRQLGEAVDTGLVNVLPMDEEGLRAAIEQPALSTGRQFEPGLVDRILGDVIGEPGSLPLLEFALTELWDEQTDRGVLTHEGYEVIGKVEGAIARRAEAIYDALAERGQGETVQRIFLRLTHYGENVEGTRRRATLDDLVTPRTPRQEIEAAIVALADARLVVTGQDAPQDTEAATAEVAHEALIRGWGRLQTWLDSDRAFGLWRERLAAAVRAWELVGRDEGALLRGAELAEAEGWLSGRGDDLNEAERTFIEESLALRERGRRRRARGTALAVAISVVVAAIMAVLGIVSYQSSQEAEEQAATATFALGVSELALATSDQRGTAEALAKASATYALGESEQRGTAVADALGRVGEQATVVSDQKATVQAAGTAEAVAKTEAQARAAEAEWQKAIAESRGLAAYAESALERDPQLAILLGVEAVKRTHSSRPGTMTRQATEVLHRAIARPRWLKTLHTGHTDSVLHAAWDPDGQRIVTASSDGTARVWDAGTGDELFTLSGHTYTVKHAAWNPDGRRIVTASSDGTAKVWDAGTGDELFTLSGHTAPVLHAAWDPDGRRIVTARWDGSARIYWVDINELLAVSCTRSDRNMTRDEWKRYIGIDVPYEKTCPDVRLPLNW
jgi:energy-coupling factor transporter ATP-binding protein EcfA2